MNQNPFAPSADPVDSLAYCAEAIRREGWFDTTGIPEAWPVTTEQVVEMLTRAGEFDIDVAGLEDLIDRGLLPAPGRDENDAFEWNAQDAVHAYGILEARQQWRATPSKHDAKKHPCRVMLEQARACGELRTLAHGGPARMDVRHLVALLAQCNIYEGRMKIAALLEAVLEVDHDVHL